MCILTVLIDNCIEFVPKGQSWYHHNHWKSCTPTVRTLHTNFAAIDDCLYSPHPKRQKSHHFISNLTKTTTSMRKSKIPSHSIHVNAAKKKYCTMADTTLHPTCAHM